MSLIFKTKLEFVMPLQPWRRMPWIWKLVQAHARWSSESYHHTQNPLPLMYFLDHAGYITPAWYHYHHATSKFSLISWHYIVFSFQNIGFDCLLLTSFRSDVLLIVFVFLYLICLFPPDLLKKTLLYKRPVGLSLSFIHWEHSTKIFSNFLLERKSQSDFAGKN